MKVALITDQHFGARNDSLTFHLFFKKFYQEFFFPYLEENGIDTVIMGGDTFDRRKYINFLTLALCKEYYFQEANKRNIRLIINTGNHDVFYKNTNEINSPQLLLGTEYELVVSEPEVFKLGSLDLLVVPWITADNYDVCMDTIRNTKCPVMFGHLELAGFEMTKGIVMDHGMKSDPFDRFDMVLTGHYHHKSNRLNVHYLGAPYEMTWADCDDPHGFHILDTETRELTFVENPYKIFHKVWYDDQEVKTPDEAVKNVDYSSFKDTYVKVVVTAKTKPAWFDIVIDKFEKAGAADLQVVDDHLNLNLELDDDIVNEAENTATMLRKYVASLDNLSISREKLENVVIGLYNEAVWASESDG
jgi:DNA repair exonuclease SbcCD nuclease subunit